VRALLEGETCLARSDQFSPLFPNLHHPLLFSKEHDPALSDADAAAFYFADQATQNEAVASALTATAAPALAAAIPSLAAASPFHLQGAAGAALLTAAGTQAAAKGRSTDPAALNEVDTALAILRLPAVASDLLVCVCTATAVGAASAVAGVVAGGAGRTGAVAGVSAGVLAGVLASLQIVDWGLFAGSGGE
jgi:hypothetical protein